MEDNYPAYDRPQFESVDLTGKTGDKLRKALKKALKTYRNKHLPKVQKAQRKWVAAARAYEQAAGLLPRNFGAFETQPCMTESPLGGANEPIEVDNLSVDASDPPPSCMSICLLALHNPVLKTGVSKQSHLYIAPGW